MNSLRKAHLLVAGGAVLIALQLARDALGSLGPGLDALTGEWFMPVAFLGSGLVAFAGGARHGRERRGWYLLGAGLALYAAGSVYYDLATPAAFPSLADILWLALYPLVLASVISLARARLPRIGAATWLDGAAAGTMVAAVAAATAFERVLDATISAGPASIARLGYPIGDLFSVGIVVAIWSFSRRSGYITWALLATGFALLALGDGSYVIQAARGTWAPGGLLDIPYALGTMLMCASAWTPAPRPDEPTPDESARILLPVGCGLVSLMVVGYAAFGDVNGVATALASRRCSLWSSASARRCGARTASAPPSPRLPRPTR